MADKYLPYTIWQVLIPFLSPYRSFWVGIGIIAFYLSLLVTITFYLKKKIGMELFRKTHYLSLVAYFGATLHGLYAGTDSVLPIANLLYKATFLVTLFLVVYWLVLLYMRKQEEEKLKKQLVKEKLRSKGKSRSVTAIKSPR
jgi:predicted ferric reductase